ncbi:hypothetical protein J6590_042204, partial [Homalodisca vitripennis]
HLRGHVVSNRSSQANKTKKRQASSQSSHLNEAADVQGDNNLGVPMAEWSKTLDFESELEIAQFRILSVTVALFISTIDLVLFQLSPLFCFDKILAQASGP